LWARRLALLAVARWPAWPLATTAAALSTTTWLDDAH
jgi:hypothetical protein